MSRFLLVAICFVLFAFLVSYTYHKYNKIDKQIDEHLDIHQLYIHPDEHVSLRTNDFIDSIQYIPLETTDESEFSEISQIEVNGDYYVVLDKVSNAILFFEKNGNFAKKISPENDDIPVPFKGINKFTIDPERKILSFYDTQSPLIYEFDLSGSFIKTIEKKPNDYRIQESYYLNTYKLNYFSYDSSTSDKSLLPSITIDKKGKEMASYLHFNPAIINDSDIFGAKKYFFKSNEQLLFSRPYDYTIYSFDHAGKMNKYLIISLPKERSIPQDFLTSREYTNKRQTYTVNHRFVIHLITDVYKVGDVLTFQLIAPKSFNTFLYDLKKNVLIDFRNYLSDASTFFLPITDNNVLGVDANRLISSISAQRLTRALNSNIGLRGYLPSLPDNLKEFYKKGNNQNPVLVLISLKKQIVYDTAG